MADNFQTFPIGDVQESPSALRKVNRDSDGYRELVDSIKRNGIFNTPTCRIENGKPVIVDGLHRFNAAKDAGLKEITFKVISLSEAETLAAQIMANVQKIETRPAEYAEQLKRMMALNPTTTVSSLAASLSKSAEWLHNVLGLLKLDKKYQALVDEVREDGKSKIPLMSAYALSRLPIDEQHAYIERAMTMTAEEFVPLATARLKEIRSAARTGKAAGPPEFVPTPHLRKLVEIKSELGTRTYGAALVANAKSPAQGFYMALEWVLGLDEASVAAAKAEFDAELKSREADRLKKAAEKTAKKAAEAKADLESKLAKV